MNPQSLAQALQPIHWPLLILVTSRVAGVMLIAPAWSQATVPASLRGAFAVIASLAILPGVPDAAVNIDSISVVAPVATELILGLAIGLSAAVFLSGVAMAAEVVSLQMGLSLGAALGGVADVGSPGIGELEGQFSLAVFVAVGGHLALLTAVARSFHAIPPGAPIAIAEGGRALIVLCGSVFTTAVQVAAPMMVALLITNIGLAVLNRAVPQLNTMMVAVPVTVSVGLIALGTAMPYALNVVAGWATGVGSGADAVIRSFTPLVAGH
ncbi:MAG TPA: flagellar biosynthetic protein FliR [Gemmatimonadales bacterium]